jgi:CHAD domain-containing protein
MARFRRHVEPHRPMAHELKNGTYAVQRIMRRQVKNAFEAIQGRAPSDSDIHGARKDLKKARAALRLLRVTLGDSLYSRTNAALRDAARPLSLVRDSKVLVEQLDALVDHFGAPARALRLDKLRRALRREHSAARRQLRRASSLGRQVAALRALLARSTRWPAGAQGWAAIGAGLRRVYGKGRTALARARAHPSPENLHEWRKQVKYLWHQLQVIEPLRPRIIGRLARDAHQLASLLGDDHDLAVLRVKVEQNAAGFDGRTASALIALIERRRVELEGKAFVLGGRIYRGEPRVFALRFARYFRTASGRRR